MTPEVFFACLMLVGIAFVWLIALLLKARATIKALRLRPGAHNQTPLWVHPEETKRGRHRLQFTDEETGGQARVVGFSPGAWSDRHTAWDQARQLEGRVVKVKYA